MRRSLRLKSQVQGAAALWFLPGSFDFFFTLYQNGNVEKVPECSEDAPIVPIFHPKLQQGGITRLSEHSLYKRKNILRSRSAQWFTSWWPKHCFYLFFFISFLGVKIKKKQRNRSDLGAFSAQLLVINSPISQTRPPPPTPPPSEEPIIYISAGRLIQISQLMALANERFEGPMPPYRLAERLNEG